MASRRPQSRKDGSAGYKQVAPAWPDQIESRSCQWLRLRHRAKQKWPWPANFQQPVVRADGQRWSLVGKWRAAKFTGNEQRPPSRQASKARHLTAETFSPRCCCCCRKDGKEEEIDDWYTSKTRGNKYHKKQTSKSSITAGAVYNTTSTARLLLASSLLSCRPSYPKNCW
jgi:hypothetical protein